MTAASPTEQRYSQTDREALAVVYGLKKFHKYLAVRVFEAVTDHKLLLGIFGRNRAILQILSPQMTRWCVLLAAYKCNLVYSAGSQLAHADTLSRLPLESPDTSRGPLEVLLLQQVSLLIDGSRIAAETAKHPLLSQVMHWVQHGWPTGGVRAEYSTFARHQQELSVDQGCLLWGNRVVIPD